MSSVRPEVFVSKVYSSSSPSLTGNSGVTRQRRLKLEFSPRMLASPTRCWSLDDMLPDEGNDRKRDGNDRLRLSKTSGRNIFGTYPKAILDYLPVGRKNVLLE